MNGNLIISTSLKREEELNKCICGYDAYLCKARIHKCYCFLDIDTCRSYHHNCVCTNGEKYINKCRTYKHACICNSNFIINEKCRKNHICPCVIS